jgi:hypothetical protein
MLPGLTFGYQQIVMELLRGVIDTVADKPGLMPERRGAAQQTVVCSVMAYNPRDPVETIMAGHCIVYDHMLRDGARDMLRGQAEEIKIKARPGILATGKMFLSTMQMLRRTQGRAEEELAFARPPAEPPAPAATPAQTPDAADDDHPIAARNHPGSSAAGTPTQAAAPQPVAGHPPSTRSTPSAPATVPASAAGAAAPPMHQRNAPAQATGAVAASVPGPATPERPAAANAPPIPPLVLPEMVEAILFDGIEPALKQEILAAAALAAQRTG